jgi:hypothetical protein
MFNKFLEEKKSVLQTIGILIAIGAIFLTIQPPENPVAKEALMKLQFFWLYTVTVSIFILYFNIFDFLRGVKFSFSLMRKLYYLIPDFDS